MTNPNHTTTLVLLTLCALPITAIGLLVFFTGENVVTLTITGLTALASSAILLLKWFLPLTIIFSLQEYQPILQPGPFRSATEQSADISRTRPPQNDPDSLTETLQTERSQTALTPTLAAPPPGWRHYHDPETGLRFQYPEYFGEVYTEPLSSAENSDYPPCKSNQFLSEHVSCTGALISFIDVDSIGKLDQHTFLAVHGAYMKILPQGGAWQLRNVPETQLVTSSLNPILRGEVFTDLMRFEPGGEPVQYINGDGDIVSHTVVLAPSVFALPYMEEGRLQQARAALEENKGPEYSTYDSYDEWLADYNTYQQNAPRVDLSEEQAVQDYVTLLRSIQIDPPIPPQNSAALDDKLANYEPLLLPDCRSDTRMLNYGYHTDGEQIWYVHHPAPETAKDPVLPYNPNTLIAIPTKPCGEPFLATDAAVVYQGEIMDVADPKHFAKLPLKNTTTPNLYRDTASVYQFEAGEGLRRVDGADPASFRPITTYAYNRSLETRPYWFFRDANNFYCTIQNGDNTHLQILPDSQADDITITSTFTGEEAPAIKSTDEYPYLSAQTDAILQHQDGRIFDHTCQQL